VTTPKIRTLTRGSSRYYVHPETGAKVPGVTSVIGMRPKPFLTFWAGKVVAEYAIDHLGDMVNIVLRGDRQGAIDYLKNAPRRTTAAAAEMGTLAHAAFEDIANGKDPKVSPDVLPFARLFARMMKDTGIEIERQEQTVYSEQFDYAGSFDGWGRINGKPVFIDNKTTKSGIHAEVALQLAAYRYSDVILHPDGSTEPTPKAEGGIVIHVRPDKLQVVEVDCDEDVFKFFLHLREVFRWVDGKDREVIAPAPFYSLDYETLLAEDKPATRRRGRAANVSAL
jgi:hypothetical protein